MEEYTMNGIHKPEKLEEKVSQNIYGTLQIEDSEQREYARKVWYETRGKELGVDPENYGSVFDIEMKDADLGTYLLEHKDLVYKLKIVPHQEKLGNFQVASHQYEKEIRELFGKHEIRAEGEVSINEADYSSGQRIFAAVLDKVWSSLGQKYRSGVEQKLRTERGATYNVISIDRHLKEHKIPEEEGIVSELKGYEVRLKKEYAELERNMLKRWNEIERYQTKKADVEKRLEEIGAEEDTFCTEHTNLEEKIKTAVEENKKGIETKEIPDLTVIRNQYKDLTDKLERIPLERENFLHLILDYESKIDEYSGEINDLDERRGELKAQLAIVGFEKEAKEVYTVTLKRTLRKLEYLRFDQKNKPDYPNLSNDAEFVKDVVNDLNNSLDSTRKKYFSHIASVDPAIFKGQQSPDRDAVLKNADELLQARHRTSTGELTRAGSAIVALKESRRKKI